MEKLVVKSVEGKEVPFENLLEGKVCLVFLRHFG